MSFEKQVISDILDQSIHKKDPWDYFRRHRQEIVDKMEVFKDLLKDYPHHYLTLFLVTNYKLKLSTLEELGYSIRPAWTFRERVGMYIKVPSDKTLNYSLPYSCIFWLDNENGDIHSTEGYLTYDGL